MNIFKKPINSLIFTQFLSAFADSVIILVIAFMNTKGNTDHNNPYIFLVETVFLSAYLIFAPFVGTFADKNPKSRVLLTGNSVKGIGILLLIFGVNPVICYGIIGIGAAIYGPAKYGILKELTKNNAELLDANGKLEGFTIFAIIIGTVVAGVFSKHHDLGQYFCLVVYILSIVLAIKIPVNNGNKNLSYKKEMSQFFKDLATSFKNEKLKFTLVGSGAFWMISVVIRNSLLLWIPLSFGVKQGFSITLTMGMTAIGIVIGSLLAKKFTSIDTYYRANIFGLVVGILAIIFPLIHAKILVLKIIVWLMLLFIGIFAGLFIIPLNATLQDEGHKILGTGKTIAVQNFVDNFTMLFGSLAVYILCKNYNFSVVASLVTFGIVYIAFILYLFIKSKQLQK